MTEMNPYRAPETEIGNVANAPEETALAGRATRLAAVLLDALFYGMALIPTFIGGALVKGEDTSMGILFAVGILLAIGVFVYNLALLSQNGWTLGKRICGIRIVRKDRSDYKQYARFPQ